MENFQESLTSNRGETEAKPTLGIKDWGVVIGSKEGDGVATR